MWALDLSAAAAKLDAMGRGAMAQLPNLAIAILVFVLFWYLSHAVSRAVASLMVRAGQQAGVALVIGRLLSWVARVVGFLVAMTILMPSLDAAALFGALGIGGVAIGFAFKDIFQNLLAGLLLLVTRPFKIGDIIVAGSHEGIVDDIHIRSTRVRLFDGRFVVIPNSDLYTGRVEVYNPQSNRRGNVEVGVTYDTDIQRAKDVILRTVSHIPGVLATPAPSVVARAFADSSITLLVRYWIGPPNRRDLVSTTDEILCALKPALDDAGIEIAFPTRVLLMQPTAPADVGGKPEGEATRAKASRQPPPSRHAIDPAPAAGGRA